MADMNLRTKKLSISGAVVVLSGFVVFQVFQNCAPTGFEMAEMSSQSPSVMSDLNHPGAAIIQPTSQKGLTANRLYVSSMLREVFGNSEFVFNVTNSLILNHPSIFGYPCDQKSGLDCQGSIVVPMNITGDTLRSAHKMQACLILTSQDVTLNHALSLITPNYGISAPHEAYIPRLYELFYRGDDPAPELVQGLVTSDRLTLRRNPASTVIDRWRLLLLAVCESSGWESL